MTTYTPIQGVRLFLWLFPAFIIATIAGTLLHECGHYLAAKLLGYQAHISYAMTYHYLPAGSQAVPEAVAARNEWIITLAGPLQTMGTGTLGLLALYLKRKRWRSAGRLAPAVWLWVFIALFWLRQTANCWMLLAGRLVSGVLSQRSDEVRLAHDAGWTPWLPSAVTGICGGMVLATITCSVVPRKERLPFLAAGLAGGCAGYYLWLCRFGPLLLP